METDRILCLMEKSIKMGSDAIKLAEMQSTKLYEDKREDRKTLKHIIIAILISFSLMFTITIYGYFFSSYDYYELPSIENTNTNTNGD